MSDITSEKVLRSMRHMAWSRAKGELQAVLNTFWNDSDNFEKLNEVIKEFIKKVDDEGLAE